jgi:hypothetical protein
MRWYIYFFLGISGLILASIVGRFQPSPGYMDADYYFAGGKQLTQGRGFNEMILWNYLDNPTGLPHPSFAYWMPLASIVAAIGMASTGSISFNAARSGFLLIAALVPPLTALLSYKLTSRPGLSLAAGLFAVFSGYYIPYFSITETFGLYMVLGATFFLLIGFGLENNENKHRLLISGGLGVIAGLAHLSRADGLIWIAVAATVVMLFPNSNSKLRSVSLLCVFLGYALIMTPWFLRNITVFGTPLAPGGNHALWLTNYDETFSFPAGKLTFNYWFYSGWSALINSRVEALKWNLQTAWAVQGGIFLLPFILIGAWRFRSDLRIKIGVLAWLVTFAVMTLVFPFAGSRGGFLHSGAAFQPLWWALVPVGIEDFIKWVEIKRKWRRGEAFKVFLIGFICISGLLSGMIFYGRIYSPPKWGSESIHLSKVEDFISKFPASSGAIAMVANPPGYFNISDRPAIAIPNENLDTVIEVAHKYGAKFLILEKDSVPSPLRNVYEKPTDLSSIQYLGEIDGARIFAIQ